MKKTIAFMLLGVSVEVVGFLISILSGAAGGLYMDQAGHSVSVDYPVNIRIYATGDTWAI